MVDHALKKYREATGTTLEDLADSVGTSKSSIWRIENGEQDPSLDLIRRLIERTGLSAEDFVNPPGRSEEARQCEA